MDWSATISLSRGGAGVNRNQVGRAAQRGDETFLPAARYGLLLAVAASGASRPGVFRSNQDGEAEDAVIKREISDAHRDQQQRPRRLLKLITIVEQAGGEAEAQLHAQQIHHHHPKPGRAPRAAHKAPGARNMKVNSIGSVTPVRKTVKRHRQEHAADRRFPLGPGGVIHGQARGGQAEHHHREEARHEGAGRGIAGEEAVQVAGRAVISRRG